MNLAVGGLMMASTSIVKMGAFSWLGIDETKANRIKTKKNIKALYLFKSLPPKNKIPQKGTKVKSLKMAQSRVLQTN